MTGAFETLLSKYYLKLEPPTVRKSCGCWFVAVPRSKTNCFSRAQQDRLLVQVLDTVHVCLCACLSITQLRPNAGTDFHETWNESTLYKDRTTHDYGFPCSTSVSRWWSWQFYSFPKNYIRAYR